MLPKFRRNFFRIFLRMIVAKFFQNLKEISSKLSKKMLRSSKFNHQNFLLTISPQFVRNNIIVL